MPDRKPNHDKLVFTESFVAETEVLKGQLVMPGTDEDQVVPATANAACLGVAMNTVTTEDIAAKAAGTAGINAIQVMVEMIGIRSVLAGGAVVFGDFVKSDANGRIVPIDGAAANPENIVGKCLHATSADGDPTHIFITLQPEYNATVQD